MSNGACVQILENTAFGNILACVSWRPACPEKAPEFEKGTHYFYSAKCLKMALLGAQNINRFRVKTTIGQMAPVSCFTHLGGVLGGLEWGGNLWKPGPCPSFFCYSHKKKKQGNPLLKFAKEIRQGKEGQGGFRCQARGFAISDTCFVFLPSFPCLPTSFTLHLHFSSSLLAPLLPPFSHPIFPLCSPFCPSSFTLLSPVSPSSPPQPSLFFPQFVPPLVLFFCPSLPSLPPFPPFSPALPPFSTLSPPHSPFFPNSQSSLPSPPFFPHYFPLLCPSPPPFSPLFPPFCPLLPHSTPLFPIQPPFPPPFPVFPSGDMCHLEEFATHKGGIGTMGAEKRPELMVWRDFFAPTPSGANPFSKLLM